MHEAEAAKQIAELPVTVAEMLHRLGIADIFIISARSDAERSGEDCLRLGKVERVGTRRKSDSDHWQKL